MSIAKIIEEALRAQGMNATVTATGEPHDDEVEVTHVSSSTYTAGGITVVVESGLGNTEVERITVSEDLGVLGTDELTLKGEAAHNFLTVMTRVLKHMSTTPA